MRILRHTVLVTVAAAAAFVWAEDKPPLLTNDQKLAIRELQLFQERDQAVMRSFESQCSTLLMQQDAYKQAKQRVEDYQVKLNAEYLKVTPKGWVINPVTLEIQKPQTPPAPVVQPSASQPTSATPVPGTK